MLKKLLPDIRVDTIYDIDLKLLYQEGVRGIMTDLDNTLVGAKQPHATPELISWLERVKDAGFQVVIVSNNNYNRVSQFATPLEIPYVHRAKKPFQMAFKKALDLMNLSAGQVVMIGDQMLTDVLGSNRMGLRSILVRPIALNEESIFTRINRRLEKIALSKLKEQGINSGEDVL